MFVQSIEFIQAHATGNGNGGKARGGHLDLGAGVELHDLALGKNEPRDSRDRGADRTRRQFPQRPATLT